MQLLRQLGKAGDASPSPGAVDAEAAATASATALPPAVAQALLPCAPPSLALLPPTELGFGPCVALADEAGVRFLQLPMPGGGGEGEPRP